ncbi:hypothetical protein 8014-B2_0018 [Lactobacillus phage ATCC 8014-B2]|uniref:Uncharacterized protein n=1 Tax=Lactobacillus phage ATCC 8014-B2 TaxID=1225795 RepID=K4I4B3_9CAUD|nr:hypothetical protein HOQ89_gp018 [Lactobacillus phage ATCC 8014-B2]AFU63085.1 hypothetical protein 8014-B2_0018 [Lactobacillus phage ATCC 8014-B2]
MTKSRSIYQLENFEHMMQRERDLNLDVIKVSARSDDQANSACNLLKKLYYYLDWMTQRAVASYRDKNNDSGGSMDFDDDKCNDRLSHIVYQQINYEDPFIRDLSSCECKFLGPIKSILNRFGMEVQVLLSYVGAGNPVPENYTVAGVVKFMQEMQETINDFLSGELNYNK